MQLKKVEIKNFRSIRFAEIEFSHNCLVLLGKNEAGKSNVLKAIAALFGQYKLSDKDKRKKIDNEKIGPTDRYIRAHFSLSPAEITTVIDRFKKKYTDINQLKFASGISLEDTIQQNFGSFHIHIPVDVGANTNTDLDLINEDALKFKTQPLLSGVAFSTVSGDKFDFKFLVLSIIVEMYNEAPIKCHFWEYKDSYLLPGAVDIASFISSPSSFKPLEHLFQLCGRDNVAEEFTNAKAEDGDYLNLLEQVSKEVTKTFHSIWSDMKETSIQLSPDGPQILIKLTNKAKYNFEDRSEGFKKFISILLMLSTQSRAKKIVENDLILIDEPDQSLYPTSAKFLRDELLQISKTAKVVYSTHSQYMIDSENIQRHLIVAKTDDVTTVSKPDKNAPYSNDELLRNAIGTSIFECIKEKNIVLEGYLDKKLFDFYVEEKKLKDEFAPYGKLFLWGISGVEAITAILQAAEKKYIIVADGDSTSNDKKTAFVQNNPERKDFWLSYADNKSGILTMEDFFQQDFIQSEIKKLYPAFVYDPSKSSITNIEKATGNVKEKKQEIKNNLVTNMKIDHVKDEYGNFITRVAMKIKDL